MFTQQRNGSESFYGALRKFLGQKLISFCLFILHESFFSHSLRKSFFQKFLILEQKFFEKVFSSLAQKFFHLPKPRRRSVGQESFQKFL